MQGHFDLKMLHTPGLTKELLAAVRAEGGDPAVERYLDKQKLEGNWRTDNLVISVAPSFFYYTAGLNAGMYYGMYGANPPENAGPLLSFVVLLQTSTEPSYSGEALKQDGDWSSITDICPSSPSPTAHKNFVDGCIVLPDIRSDPNGREAIYGKYKFLYLPGECTASNIRSIGVWYCAQFGGGASYAIGRAARVRIKDNGGNPVTLNKTATKSLLIEYTFTLASV